MGVVKQGFDIAAQAGRPVSDRGEYLRRNRITRMRLIETLPDEEKPSGT
jgi:hypothetical protein